MRKSTILITLGICLLLCLVLFPVVAWIGCYFMPREYTSSAAIEVKPSIVGPMIAMRVYAGVDPHFIDNQIKIIQSKGILFPVIDELGLVDKWSPSFPDNPNLPANLKKEEAYEKLVKMISGKQRANTNMLIIEVTSRDRQEAADIANTIAVIYLKRRRDDQEALIDGGLAELSQEVEKQHHKVELAKAGLEKIRDRDHVIDPNPDDEKAQPVTPPNQDYEAAKKSYFNEKKVFDSGEQRYETERMNGSFITGPWAEEMWDRAEPSKTPSSPNVPRIMLIATGLGALCAIPGALLLFIGLHLRRQEDASLPI